MVDGGARFPLGRRIIADVTGVEFAYIWDAQGAPLGDCILAGLGTGTICDHDVVESWLGEKTLVKPDPEASEVYRRYYSLYKKRLEANLLIFKDF